MCNTENNFLPNESKKINKIKTHLSVSLTFTRATLPIGNITVEIRMDDESFFVFNIRNMQMYLSK